MIREDGSIQEFCVWDGVAIPEARRRKQAVTCCRECARARRKHYLLERKERYRRAAGLSNKGQGTVGEEKCIYGERNHVPGVSEIASPGSCLPAPVETVLEDRG